MIDGAYVLHTIAHRMREADPRYPAQRFAEGVAREAGCPRAQGYTCERECADPDEYAAACWIRLAEEA